MHAGNISVFMIKGSCKLQVAKVSQHKLFTKICKLTCYHATNQCQVQDKGTC